MQHFVAALSIVHILLFFSLSVFFFWSSQTLLLCCGLIDRNVYGRNLPTQADLTTRFLNFRLIVFLSPARHLLPFCCCLLRGNCCLPCIARKLALFLSARFVDKPGTERPTRVHNISWLHRLLAWFAIIVSGYGSKSAYKFIFSGAYDVQAQCVYAVLCSVVVQRVSVCVCVCVCLKIELDKNKIAC